MNLQEDAGNLETQHLFPGEVDQGIESALLAFRPLGPGLDTV